MFNKNKITSFSYKWHQKMACVGAIILLIFVLSAMTHPLLSWTGPKAKTFFPPSFTLEAEKLENISKILEKNQLSEAQQLKVIASRETALLQVTEDSDTARRYFDLTTGGERLNYDIEQAKYLAEYYSGQASSEVESVEFISEFSNDYPWVNRLLPVYRVNYKGEEGLSLYVHTELNALASVNNSYKRSLQSVFQNLHTFSFLNKSEYVRVILVALMMLILIVLCFMGVVLLRNLKKRKLDPLKRWHRNLAYAVWVPLLMFSFSGLYHLLHSSGVKRGLAMEFGPKLQLSNIKSVSLDIDKKFPHCTSASLVNRTDGGLAFRVALSAGSGNIDRKNKYKGLRTEGEVLYFNVTDGNRLEMNDADYAKEAMQFFVSDEPKSQKLITHFGPHYDFRNKRLPVWQFDYNNGDKVFFDCRSGTIVDRLKNPDRCERYSFSLLHKWNFLTPLTKEPRLCHRCIVTWMYSFSYRRPALIEQKEESIIND